MKKNFEKLTDEELIRRARKGDEGAANFLMEKYKGLVRGKARFLHMMGGDAEDMIQEGMIGLFKAVRDYDEQKEASFSTFANLCITRQLATAVEGSLRKKHMPLNTALSLNATEAEPSGETKDRQEREHIELLASGSEYEPEARLIEKENIDYIANRIREVLTPLERRVLNLYLTGLPVSEIAGRIDKPLKSAENAMQRVRSKLKKYL